MSTVTLRAWMHSLVQKDRSFYYYHMNRLTRNLQIWNEKFPNIHPYYAVKCNPNRMVLETQAMNGCNFDCASKTEIREITTIKRELETDTDIVFANPIKMNTHLQYASKVGVQYMTVDCPEELEKIEKYHDNAKVILRIAVDDSKSLCKFNSKYGMFLESDNLKRFFDKFDTLVKSKLVGVSFHVGSGCWSSDSYKTAIENSRECFDFAEKRGYKLNVLDIGGGFVQKEPFISDVSSVINNSIKDQFSSLNPKVIAEPGRFFVENIADLYVKVIGKKTENGVIKYYVNNSVYGDFNCKIFDYAQQNYDLLKFRSKKLLTEDQKGIWKAEECGVIYPTTNSTVFGATCDSIDVILENVQMPELELGDLIRFNHMGAYTSAASSEFNGLAKPKIYYYGQAEKIMTEIKDEKERTVTNYHRQRPP